jgi:hypothetical protein
VHKEQQRQIHGNKKLRDNEERINLKIERAHLSDIAREEAVKRRLKN